MAGLKQVFRTQLWEHREPRFLRLLVKAGKIQEKDEANSIELYERVIEMGERVADAQLSLAYLIEKDYSEHADKRLAAPRLASMSSLFRFAGQKEAR